MVIQAIDFDTGNAQTVFDAMRPTSADQVTVATWAEAIKDYYSPDKAGTPGDRPVGAPNTGPAPRVRDPGAAPRLRHLLHGQPASRVPCAVCRVPRRRRACPTSSRPTDRPRPKCLPTARACTLMRCAAHRTP
ncbi:hypothetical protein GCM10010405_05390 [Streptomyces macrosporus]|uniref:Uncharacterized protein n=1 Tax=Streptomyces macrosporus TaxID=44032 RepID=A0ABN3JCE5_9ACTN